jgi:hypothetical protein
LEVLAPGPPVPAQQYGHRDWHRQHRWPRCGRWHWVDRRRRRRRYWWFWHRVHRYRHSRYGQRNRHRQHGRCRCGRRQWPCGNRYGRWRRIRYRHRDWHWHWRRDWNRDWDWRWYQRRRRKQRSGCWRSRPRTRAWCETGPNMCGHRAVTGRRGAHRTIYDDLRPGGQAPSIAPAKTWK